MNRLFTFFINLYRRLFKRKNIPTWKFVATKRPKIILIHTDYIEKYDFNLNTLMLLNSFYHLTPDVDYNTSNEDGIVITNKNETTTLLIEFSKYLNLNMENKTVMDYYRRNQAIRSIFRNLRAINYDYVVIIIKEKLPDFVDYEVDERVYINDFTHSVTSSRGELQ